MTLRLVDEAARTAAWPEEWAFPDELIHLRSGAYKALREDLDRYLHRQVTGRSFLIAGHRGTGKTTTVLRVVQDAYRSAIEGSIALASGSGELTPDLFQRPLLVKLHGPSLTGKRLPGPKGGDEAESDAHAMLVQICIALYRAFAGELAACFARHARGTARSAAARPDARADRMELASQLALDLDQGCDPASLRACWDRLGRLSSGVLWPGSVGEALVRAGYGNRGMQEVIAAATAGQAFQVCSGRVTYNEARRDAASRDSAVETGVRLDARDVVNKLWGLAAGGLVGAAVWPVSSVGAAIAGLGAGVIGSLAMSWTGKRSLRNERSTDYRFVIERSVATLDRELPVVIGRIRDCGLAPVFVIDELDKVDNGGAFIPDIINRLKNLITDFGFFCFLTDRDYYESVERVVRARAFPKEASYFSKRLMVAFHPAAMGLHAHERMREVAPVGSNDARARWVLSCVMPYRAKCNMLDLVRELTGQGEMPLSDRVVVFPQYRWPMVLQLAIEHALRKPDLRTRIGTELGFLQLALDAMYIIPRAWEAGYEGVDLSRDNVRRCLMDRMRIPGVNALERERVFSAMVTDDDMDLLHQEVVGLAALLQSFGAVRDAISAEADFGPSAVVSDAIVVFERERFFAVRDLFSDMASLGLMEPEMPGSDMWRFSLVPDGRQRAPAPLPAPTLQSGALSPSSTPSPATGALPLDIATKIEGAVGEYRDFMAALNGLVEDLSSAVNLGLLPASFVPAQLDQIAAYLERARNAGVYYRELDQDLLVMQGVTDTLRERQRAIAAILALARRIVDDGQRFGAWPRSLDGALRTVDALIGIRAAIASVTGDQQERLSMFRELRCPDSPLLDTVLPAAPLDAVLPPAPVSEHPGTWDGAIAAAYQRIAAGAPLEPSPVPAAWEMWEERLRAFIRPQAAHRVPLAYAELVLHAALQFPSTAFDTSNVEQTTVRGWSMLCMHAFNNLHMTPSWVLPGGLRALGFGPRAIGCAVALLANQGDGLLQYLTAGAPPDRRGALTLYDGSPPEVANLPPIPPTPVFVVPWDDIESYRGILRWLLDNGLVEDEGIDDESDP